MKRSIFAVMLWLCAAQPSLAQEEAQVPEAPPPAAGEATPPEAIPAPAAPAGDELDPDVVERRVKGRVLKFVDSVLEAADESLTEEDKREILREIEAEFEGAKRDRGGAGLTIDISDSDHGSDDSIVEYVVPALAVVLIFGTPIIVVIAVLYAGYRKRRLVQETISQYLASGKDVPPEILENLQGGARPKNYLQKGLVMTGVGLGVIACFAMIGSTAAASLGLIPLFIGLAQLLIWKMEGNDEGAGK